ncbi:unnamed protein product [Cochlearia groenlandica]
MAGKLFLLCVFCFVFVISVLSVSVSGEYITIQSEDKPTTVWLSKIKQSGNDYWTKLKEALGHGHSRFFPPNTYGKGEGGMGAGEKMKEAATRSFENSKDTVEEAARSAAEAARDAAGAVKDKVTRTVSGKERSEEL